MNKPQILWKDLEKIQATTPETPALYYLEKDLQGAILAFQQGLEPLSTSGQGLIFYAVKSCYNPLVLKSLAAQGVGAEVMSELEYDLAIKAGFLPQNILLNGLARDKHFLQEAAIQGSIIIVDSPQDFLHLKEIRKELPTINLRLGLRFQLNLTNYPHSPYSRTEHKLGLKPDTDLVDEIITFANLPHTRLELVHAHITINESQPDIYLYALAELHAITEQLRRRLPKGSIKTIDIGGGFGTFARDQRHLIPGILNPIVKEFQRLFHGYNLAIEPGRSISNAAGYVVTKVLDIKTSGSTVYAIVDAGMNVLIPIPDSRYRLILPPTGENQEVALCDRITSPAHVITRQKLESIPVIGSLATLGNCGAYTDVFATCWVFDLYTVTFVALDGSQHSTRTREDITAIRNLYLKSPV